MESDRVQFGKYILDRRIAVGGMAEVFLARVEGPEGVAKQVVIKRILPRVSRDRHFVDMFIDEARISVLLRHGNIVPVFDFGKVEDSFYLAMEYVDGVALGKLLRGSRDKRLQLPLELAVFVAAEVCKGLDHAHRLRDAKGEPLRVVHRDVSPQNVMISFDGEVKLLDFGIARAAGRISSTAVGVVKGKSSYMSPEQVQGLPVDARSDLFSLGTILWEMLAGRRLFDGEALQEVFEAIARAVVVPPSRHRAEVPGELDRVVLRALGREPKNRYQSAAEMGGDLAHALYRLTPGFLPQALSAFAREACGMPEQPRASGGGFEDALVGQLGDGAQARTGTAQASTGSGGVTAPLRPPVPHREASGTPGSSCSEELDDTPGRSAAADPSGAPGALQASDPARTADQALARKQSGTAGRPRPAPTPRLTWALVAVVLLVATGLLAWWFVGPGRPDETASGARPDKTNNNVTGHDATGGGVAGHDATGSGTTGKDVAGRDTTGSGATGRDVRGRDAKGTEAAGRDATGSGASGKDVTGHDANGEDVAGHDVTGSGTTGRAGEGRRQRRRVRPRPDVARGKVRINAEPWANVYFRGKLLGHTPLLDVELPVGHHVLRLVNPEFGAEKRVTIDVDTDTTAKAVVHMLE